MNINFLKYKQIRKKLNICNNYINFVLQELKY